MRTLGLFTIYLCNYGAVLQTYALKKYIENQFSDIKVSVVDFYSNEHYRIFRTSANSPIKKFVKLGMIMTHFPALVIRNNSEKRFIAEEFNLSRRFETVEELFKEVPVYDYYLTGSDQVFNSNSKYSDIFFQQFEIIHGIKLAYAPSFGKSIFFDEEKEHIRKLTQVFDFLSCREIDGAHLLSELHSKEVPCVIDPTLLLTSNQWKQMMISPKTNDRYLLIYDLNGGSPMLDIARKIAFEKGLKTYCITRHPDIGFIYRNIDKVIYDAGPREFVGYFSKASYVITDSFHGTAFSIIFRKDFNTYIAVKRSSQRIKSLLEQCNLKCRIIEDSNLLDTAENCQNQFSEESFAEYRQHSIDYLTKILR